MSLGVRREVVLRLPNLLLVHQKPLGEGEDILVASVGCVVGRPFGIFVFGKVLGGGRTSPSRGFYLSEALLRDVMLINQLRVPLNQQG